jgi:amino-acid N-acetyltransferase
MEFVKATGTDLEQATLLIEASGLPTVDINQSNQKIYILKEDNKIIATSCLEIYDQEAILRSFAVEETRRNTGIGTFIYKETLKEAKKHGLRKLILLTTTAENYFKKQGWKVTQRENISEQIKHSTEFNSVCPSTAVCMYLDLIQD